MTQKDIIRRGKDIEFMVNTPGFIDWLKPDIEKEIDKCNNIDNIDKDNVESSFRNMRLKRDIYRGILYKIDAWLKEYRKYIKEENNG